MLTEKFKRAIKLSKIPAYQLANEVGLNPSTFSKFLIGYCDPKSNDPRLFIIGERLGLKPKEIFKEKSQPLKR